MKNKVAKYNVGDRVTYMDIHNVKKIGTVMEIEETEVHEWNKHKKQKYLYLLSSSPYLRYEEEILDFCNE